MAKLQKKKKLSTTKILFKVKEKPDFPGTLFVVLALKNVLHSLSAHCHPIFQSYTD